MKSSRPRLQRSYTLLALQNAVKAQLDVDLAHLPADQQLAPPAMPTLKLWSSQDVFAGAHSLPEGVALVMNMMFRNRHRYQSRQTPGLPKKDEPRTLGDLDAGSTRLLSIVLDLQKELSNIGVEVKRISDMTYSNNSQRSISHGEAEVPSQAIIRAVEQLDAVRKHTLVSYDREVQLMRQQTGAQPVNRFEGASALDIQRVLARVSNLESVANRILQRLE